MYPPPSPVLLANQATEERGLCRAPQWPVTKAEVPIPFCLPWNRCVNLGQGELGGETGTGMPETTPAGCINAQARPLRQRF